MQPSLKSKQLTMHSTWSEKMLCGHHFGREIAGMNKWEKPKVRFTFSGWRWWKVAHNKIQKCLLLECVLGPLSHRMPRCVDGLFSLTVVGPCDSPKEDVWKNAVLIEEKCGSLGKAQLTGDCVPMRKQQIYQCSSRESSTMWREHGIATSCHWSMMCCFQDL